MAQRGIIGLGVAALLASSVTSVHANGIQTFEVKSRLIENFLVGSDQKMFGPLEFVGGLEMTASSQDFGAWSGIALKDDQTSFVGVLDTGFWMSGQIARDGENRPTGMTASIQPIIGQEGVPIVQKWRADAEGIAWFGDALLVSFERAHRIDSFSVSSDGYDFQDTNLPPVPLYELRQNRGFEGIDLAPATAPFAGAVVGVSEKSLDKNGNIMAFVGLDADDSFEFSVKRNDAFDITDMAFLPDGDLILLERRFNVSEGLGIRLRRIASADIAERATVDGPVLLEADLRYQIDNFEGLSITQDEDGVARLTIVSDDNHSLFQRNLLMEFRLKD